MRELHVVGTDAEGALLLADEPGGQPRYRLEDSRVVPGPRDREIRRQPSPAQIQARLRSGVRPEAIARETGADVDRVLRWAAPVQAEMDDVLRGARGAHVIDGERRSALALDELAANAAGDDEVEWQATRRADGRWRVLLRLQGEGDGSARTASWIWDGRRRRLEAASSRARRLSFED